MNAAAIFGDLSSGAGRADPYPLYAKLHELGAASAIDQNFFAVNGYREVSESPAQPRLRSLGRAHGGGRRVVRPRLGDRAASLDTESQSTRPLESQAADVRRVHAAPHGGPRPRDRAHGREAARRDGAAGRGWSAGRLHGGVRLPHAGGRGLRTARRPGSGPLSLPATGLRPRRRDGADQRSGNACFGGRGGSGTGRVLHRPDRQAARRAPRRPDHGPGAADRRRGRQPVQ